MYTGFMKTSSCFGVSGLSIISTRGGVGSQGVSTTGSSSSTTSGSSGGGVHAVRAG